jgi:hypothetical protein
MTGDQLAGFGVMAIYVSIFAVVGYGLWTRERWRPWPHPSQTKKETPEQRDKVLWWHTFYDVKREHPELSVIAQREEAQRRFERIAIHRAQEFARLRDG